MPELAEAARKTKAWACYDCGKCTATCPISRVGGDYSPRRHVLATNLGHRAEVVGNASLFTCLTCSLCDQRCPAGVAYTDLVMRLREFAHQEGVEPDCPHGGTLQSAMRMMAQGGMQQNRMGWLSEDLKTEVRTGEVTTAVRDVRVNSLQVREGQIIGLVDGELLTAGEDLDTVVLDVLRRMDAEDAEILTLYCGETVAEENAQELVARIEASFPQAEVEIVEGGQPHYHYILSAE